MKNEPVAVENISVEKTLNYMDAPVLHYRIDYPQFRHPEYQKQLDGINAWYREMAEDLQGKYETELYRNASELYEDSRTGDFPFHMHDAIFTYVITYNQNGVISLYHDEYIYSGGAHGITVRQSETWNIKDGCRIYLYQFSGDPSAFRAEILGAIREQIALQTETGEGMYFENYPELISEHFNPESFYLTPEGLTLYYQQYDIAPYAAGMPEFRIRL